MSENDVLQRSHVQGEVQGQVSIPVALHIQDDVEEIWCHQLYN